MADLTQSSPSPFPPSPSPLSHHPPSTSSSSSSNSISWHFPGPSTRYHISDKTRPRHSRFQTSTTVGIAPKLSTERRAAHRRTQSTAQVPHADLTPPASEHTRSPLLRFTSTPTMGSLLGPATPAKHAPLDPRLQDSPFSDYFTDDARSTADIAGPASYDAPSTETQQMMVRLHTLQAQLMRAGETEREALNIVGRKIGEIERELNELHSQTRRPADMDDSGLFMDDESPTVERGDPFEGHGGILEEEEEAAPDDVTPENKQAEVDYQLVEAECVLESVTKAQEELRQRHAELVQLNDVHVMQIEDKDQEIERLQSENEGLRSDLGFDHGELLFMKLQLKALEVEVDGKDESDQDRDADTAGSKRRTRNSTLEEMDRWRSDWHDVDARLRRRRSKYGVLSTGHQSKTLGSELLGRDEGEGGDGEKWQLETVKRARDRVESITIKRLDSGYQPPSLGLDGAADDGAAEPAMKTCGCESDEVLAAEQSQSTHPRPSPSLVSCAEYQIDDEYSDLQNAKQGRSHYADQATQTDPPRPSSSSSSDWTSQEDGTERDYEDEDDDCAITTTASTPEPRSPVLTALAMPVPVPVKTAWKELWEGLSSLAGMTDEDEDQGMDKEER